MESAYQLGREAYDIYYKKWGDSLLHKFENPYNEGTKEHGDWHRGWQSRQDSYDAAHDRFGYYGFGGSI